MRDICKIQVFFMPFFLMIFIQNRLTDVSRSHSIFTSLRILPQWEMDSWHPRQKAPIVIDLGSLRVDVYIEVEETTHTKIHKWSFKTCIEGKFVLLDLLYVHTVKNLLYCLPLCLLFTKAERYWSKCNNPKIPLRLISKYVLSIWPY